MKIWQHLLTVCVFSILNMITVQAVTYNADSYPICSMIRQSQQLGVAFNIQNEPGFQYLIPNPSGGNTSNSNCNNWQWVVVSLLTSGPPNIYDNMGLFANEMQYFGYNANSKSIELMYYSEAEPEAFQFQIQCGDAFDAPFFVPYQVISEDPTNTSPALSLWVNSQSLNAGLPVPVQDVVLNLDYQVQFGTYPCPCGTHPQIPASEWDVQSPNMFINCVSVCKHGYVLIDSEQNTCLESYLQATNVNNTSAKIQVVMSDAYPTWDFECTVTSSPEIEIIQFNASNSEALGGITLSKLLPNSEYLVTCTIIDSNSTNKTTIAIMDTLTFTTGSIMYPSCDLVQQSHKLGVAFNVATMNGFQYLDINSGGDTTVSNPDCLQWEGTVVSMLTSGAANIYDYRSEFTDHFQYFAWNEAANQIQLHYFWEAPAEAFQFSIKCGVGYQEPYLIPLMVLEKDSNASGPALSLWVNDQSLYANVNNDPNIVANIGNYQQFGTYPCACGSYPSLPSESWSMNWPSEGITCRPICDVGYVYVNDTCVLGHVTIITQNYTSVEWIIETEINTPNWQFVFNLTDVNNASNPIPVNGFTNARVNESAATSGIIIPNLGDSSMYAIEGTILDSHGKVLLSISSTSFATKSPIYPTCSTIKNSQTLGTKFNVQSENGFQFLQPSASGTNNSNPACGSWNQQTVSLLTSGPPNIFDNRAYFAEHMEYFGWNSTSQSIQLMYYWEAPPRAFEFQIQCGTQYAAPYMVPQLVLDENPSATGPAITLWVNDQSLYSDAVNVSNIAQNIVYDYNYQVQFGTFPCDCGYYPQISDSWSVYSPNTDITCSVMNMCEYEINPCDADTLCIPYTQAVYQCFSVEPQSTSVTFTIATNIGAGILSGNENMDAWTIVYNVTDWSNPSYPLAVYSAQNARVSVAAASSGINVYNLNPGTNYSIAYALYDSNNNPIDATDPVEYRFFKTLCTCGQETDAPLDLTAIQDSGYVYFTFLSNSMCGDAYSFSRQQVLNQKTYTSPMVFTPNYFYYTGLDCSKTPFSPGKEASDNLALSKLIVGGLYQYNIRAVGNGYLGDISSIDHVVRWEASVAGFVGLNPNAGDLPVQGVNVTWALRDLDGVVQMQGNTTTGRDGKFSVVLNELLPFENDAAYPLEIHVAKTTYLNDTSEIHHQFLCNNGKQNCTATGMVVHLRHLEFNVPVNIIDTTAVPVTGMVYAANTQKDFNGQSWGGLGCPLMNIDVCLVDKSPGGNDKKFSCVKTDGQGRYSVPGVIGSRVSIAASYTGHEFEYVPIGPGQNLDDGFVIEPHQLYQLNNFQDTTTTQLSVTLAGGLCDLYLGESTMSIQIPGCEWGGSQIQMASVTEVFNHVMAQNVEVSVVKVSGYDTMSLPPQYVDLTQTQKQNTSSQIRGVAGITNSSTVGHTTDISSPANNITAIRFQYNGTVALRAVFEDDMKGDCSVPSGVSGVSGEGFHVLPFQTVTNATFYITRDLGNNLMCDAVDPSMSLQIQNNLGLVGDSPDDEEFRDEVEKMYPPIVVSLLQHCSDGCSIGVIQDYDPILKRNTRARVEFPYMTGRPSISSPFTKTLSVSTEGEVPPAVYDANVIIVGQYRLGDWFTVGVPTYNPLLIIRDPPGGGSSSFYKNVQSTIRLEDLNFQEFSGSQYDYEVYLGLNMKFSLCEGLGVEACQKTFETKTKAGYKVSNQAVNLDTLKQYHYSGGFTTTWSYETSNQAKLAGDASDVFVIPNLRVKYALTDIIHWNVSTCTVWETQETTFNLQSPDNVPAISFVSAHEIENIEIPELDSNIAILISEINQTQDQEKLTQLKQELAGAENALQGWQSALQMNIDAKEMAKNGSSYLIRPNEWFQRTANKTFDGNNTISTTGMSHNSAFVPSQLVADAVPRPGAPPGSAQTYLNAINTLVFSGGGNTFTYELDTNGVAQHMSALGGSGDNSQSSGTSLGKASTDNTLTGIWIGGKFQKGTATNSVHSHIQTDGEETTTSVGFSLSDPDMGDYFQVQVYIDPMFGTFVFETMGGQSMCPTEANTNERVSPSLSLVSVPPVTVLEDEPIFFEVQLTNNGIDGSTFVLSVDPSSDTGDLLISPLLPRTYPWIGPGQTITTRIALSRPPMGAYTYSAISLHLRAACDTRILSPLDLSNASRVVLYNHIDPSTQAESLVYTRPCQPIYLAGDLARDNGFQITTLENTDATVTVSIRNPLSAYMSLYNATQDASTRLQQVQLQYRPMGTTKWSVGETLVGNKLVPIDFAQEGLEDGYGYVNVNWNMQSFAQGEYEMQVQAICTMMDGAPAEFGSFTTMLVAGVVDQSYPKLFGVPTPVDELPVGTSIVVDFDETLDCSKPYRFSVYINVSDVQQGFANENLLLVCEDRSIEIQFDQEMMNVQTLVGHHLRMDLSGVVDVNGNMMKGSISYEANIVKESDSKCGTSTLSKRNLFEDGTVGDHQPSDNDFEAMHNRFVKQMRQEMRDEIQGMQASLVEAMRHRDNMVNDYWYNRIVLVLGMCMMIMGLARLFVHRCGNRLPHDDAKTFVGHEIYP